MGIAGESKIKRMEEELIDRGKLQIEYVPIKFLMNEMIAPEFTKALYQFLYSDERSRR